MKTTKYVPEITTDRQPAGAEVATFAALLADRALHLAERVNVKLHPVMTSDQPRSREGGANPLPEYPPLFADLRGNFQAIGDALDDIEYAMARTEL